MLRSLVGSEMCIRDRARAKDENSVKHYRLPVTFGTTYGPNDTFHADIQKALTQIQHLGFAARET